MIKKFRKPSVKSTFFENSSVFNIAWKLCTHYVLDKIFSRAFQAYEMNTYMYRQGTRYIYIHAIFVCWLFTNWPAVIWTCYELYKSIYYDEKFLPPIMLCIHGNTVYHVILSREIRANMLGHRGCWVIVFSSFSIFPTTSSQTRCNKKLMHILHVKHAMNGKISIPIFYTQKE